MLTLWKMLAATMTEKVHKKSKSTITRVANPLKNLSDLEASKFSQRMFEGCSQGATFNNFPWKSSLEGIFFFPKPRREFLLYLSEIRITRETEDFLNLCFILGFIEDNKANKSWIVGVLKLLYVFTCNVFPNFF